MKQLGLVVKVVLTTMLIGMLVLSLMQIIDTYGLFTIAGMLIILIPYAFMVFVGVGSLVLMWTDYDNRMVEEISIKEE